MIDFKPQRPATFVCYSHKDASELRQLLPVLERKTNTIDLWHDGLLKSGVTWFPELKRKLRRAKIAVVLVSPNLLTSEFVQQEEIPYILAKRAAGGMIYVPIPIWGMDEIKKNSDPKLRWIFDQNPALEFGKDLRGIENPGEALEQIARALDVAISDVQLQPKALVERASQWSAERCDVSRLPSSGKDCFGRDEDADRLDNVWRQATRSIYVVLAAGGYGKSTLIDLWLRRLLDRGGDGVERIFAWSFYNQGSKENLAVSAQEFVETALGWFGDPEPGIGSAWDKGERLARLVGTQRAILILDGLEPLQWTVGSIGAIKDHALIALLEGLLQRNDGLCVITTRQKIQGLGEDSNRIVQRALDLLAPDAGRLMLRASMVRADDEELCKLSDAVGNHALAVTLLGAWLTRKHLPIDLTAHELLATEVPTLLEREPKHTNTIERARDGAFQVLRVIHASLFGTAELELLRIAGLFDRPCHLDEVHAFLAGPALEGLSERLAAPMSGHADLLDDTLGRLCDLHLLSYGRIAGTIDAHPLVREFFAATLWEHQPASARSAHSRLADYFASLGAAHPRPSSLEAASPLYRSAQHRAMSGDVTSTFAYYRDAIMRNDERHSHNVLAAYGNDIAVLTPLFEIPWSKLTPAVPAKAHPALLRDIAICWQTLGNWEHAFSAMQASLASAIGQEARAEASYTASWFSEFLVVQGKLADAAQLARQAVEHGRLSGNLFAYKSALSSVGDALHQLGQIETARGYFEEGIDFQSSLDIGDEGFNDFVLQGFHYCNLLASLGLHEAAEKFSRQQIASGRSAAISNLTLALDHVALARATLALSWRDMRPRKEIEDLVNNGIRMVRESHDATFLPAALLTRAILLRAQHKYDEAETVISQIKRLAKQGLHMPIAMIDARLEEIKLRLAGRTRARTELKSDLDGIRSTVLDYRYFRVLPDIAILQTELA